MLLIGVLVLVRNKTNEAAVHRELVELRLRLDGMATAQSDRLGEAGRAVADVRERLGSLVESTKRLEAVGETVADVQELLRVPKLRGTLGETWLEEMLQQVFPASLYRTQYTFKSGETVDAVLRIGPRLVPIDSKFPLEACQRMLDATGEERNRETRNFHRSLRARVDEIATKYIRPEENTYDFALMYVPAESVFYEAVKHGVLDDGSPASYALAHKVIMVSPNTFYAYLTAIMHGLKGMEVGRRAKEIQESLAGLQGRFERFERNFDLVGKHLLNATRQYEEAEKQLGGIVTGFDTITQIGEIDDQEKLSSP